MNGVPTAKQEPRLDLGSLDAVRRFARELDVRPKALVCNAGLQVTQGLTRSAEGFETTFAVNHLGHFLLTNLLLTRLLASAPARIVVVASGVHDPALRTGMPKADVADLDTLAATGGPRPGAYDGRLAYVNSKLCNLWFTYELVRRLQHAGLSNGTSQLTVNGFDPGLVPGSGLARDYAPALRFVWNRVLPGLARVLSPVVAGINPAPKAGARVDDRQVLPVAHALARGDVVERVVRRRARPRSLGRERANDEAGARRVAARRVTVRAIRYGPDRGGGYGYRYLRVRY